VKFTVGHVIDARELDVMLNSDPYDEFGIVKEEDVTLE
jgi:hypothetical protein